MHGANLEKIARELNLKPEDFVDFSSNVNPFGPSKKAIKCLENNLDKISTYPDPNYRDLKEAISEYANCKISNISLGLGATEFITDSIKYINPKNALIIIPSYDEYFFELRRTGSKIFEYKLQKEREFAMDIAQIKGMIIEEKIDAFVFANPNNPTGRAISKRDLRELLELGVFLIVDETYVEFSENKSAAELCEEFENLLVVRSTSKFFASPGIRLGYSITSNASLKKYFEENSYLWEINVFADILAREFFRDKEYQNMVNNHNREWRDKFFKCLKALPLNIYKSESNIILCEIKGELTAEKLREKLIREGLVIRDCSSFRGLSDKFFRFCIMDEKSNKKLIELLSNIL